MSQRMVVYYEKEWSATVYCGPLNKKILKTAKLLEGLPKTDQKAVLHYVDALVKKNAPAKG